MANEAEWRALNERVRRVQNAADHFQWPRVTLDNATGEMRVSLRRIRENAQRNVRTYAAAYVRYRNTGNLEAGTRIVGVMEEGWRRFEDFNGDFEQTMARDITDEIRVAAPDGTGSGSGTNPFASFGQNLGLGAGLALVLAAWWFTRPVRG